MNFEGISASQYVCCRTRMSDQNKFHQLQSLYPDWYPVYDESSDQVTGKLMKREFTNDYTQHDSINKQLLHAIYQQNRLLQRAFDKLSNYIDKNSVTTTKDWNFIQPYLKQEVHENFEKK